MYNGTVALVAALKALGIGPGDEVITTSFTFAATLNAILESGATARFADIDELLPRTRRGGRADRRADAGDHAGAPVRTSGRHARVRAPRADRGVAMVEDAAQAHGARVGGRAVGSYGVGCFSLYGTKNVTAVRVGWSPPRRPARRPVAVAAQQGMRARYQYETAGYN